MRRRAPRPCPHYGKPRPVPDSGLPQRPIDPQRWHFNGAPPLTPPPRQTVPAPLTAAYPNTAATRSADTPPFALLLVQFHSVAHRASLYQHHHRPPPNPQTAAPARCAGTSTAPPLTPPLRQTVPAPWTAPYPNGPSTRCAGASMAVSAMFYRVITSLVVRTWRKLCTATCYSTINSFLSLL